MVQKKKRQGNCSVGQVINSP